MVTIMLCYKDQTFCLAAKDGRCVNSDCFRYFDEQTQKDVDKRWGKPDDGPVAFSDFWETCKIKKENGNGKD